MEKEDISVDTEKTKKNKKQRTCLIHLLNGQQFRCETPKQANGSVLLKQVYDLLNIVESDYFGLYFKDLSEQKYWLEANKSIKKQVKNGPWCFYFSVKFYPPDPAQLLEDITRYYMVLQLRDDIVGGRLPCSFVTHSLLGSYVVQSELGDYDRGDMRGNYVSDFSFAPNQTRDLEDRIMELHKTLRGQTPEQAEKNYLENAKKLPFYGVDLHVSQDSDGIKLFVGISWNGILVYRDGTPINRFAWPRIIKLSYVRSKFYITIRPMEGDSHLSMIGFKMPNHRAAKTAWKSSVEHHSFFRLSRAEQPRRPQLVRVGSKFRYSGRTQHETRTAVAQDEERVAPRVVRSDSRRLRSGADRPLVKAPLLPVKEESSSELPPRLPTKKQRKKAEDVVDSVVRTTEETVTIVTETVEMQLVSTAEAGAPKEQDDSQKLDAPLDRKSLTSSSSDDEEDKDHDLSHLAMTEHQKSVHRLKPTSEITEDKVEFLESETPRKTASQDSLDMIDARLSPRKNPLTVDNTTPDKEILMNQQEIMEIVTTDTITVLTHEEKVHHASQHPESLKQDDAVLSSSNASTISSHDADELLKDQLEANPSDVDAISRSTSSCSNPIIHSPSEQNSSSSSPTAQAVEALPSDLNHVVEETGSYIVTAPEDMNGNVVNGNLPDHEGSPIEIATVETRTVRVEDVVIPRKDYKVREISLTPDKEESISPSRSPGEIERCSVSSLSSSSSNSSNSKLPLYEPPTVKTAPLVVDSYVEEAPTGTTNPPMVHTELKTITYESTKPATIENSQPQLVSSQIISSETEHTVTTTEITKIVRGEVSETRVEKQMVTIGNSGVDHNKVMAEMIRDTQRNNPNINITKVVVLEERSVVGSD